MRQKSKEINKNSIEFATFLKRSQYNKVIELSVKFRTDPERKRRMEECLCVVCYYRMDELGGAAITHRTCGKCGIDQVYSSTNTDVLCLDCAKKLALCKHCGADIVLYND